MNLETQRIKEVFDKWDRGQIREIKISNLKLTVNVGEDLFENKWTQIYFEKDGKNLGMIFKLSDKKQIQFIQQKALTINTIKNLKKQ